MDMTVHTLKYIHKRGFYKADIKTKPEQPVPVPVPDPVAQNEADKYN